MKLTFSDRMPVQPRNPNRAFPVLFHALRPEHGVPGNSVTRRPLVLGGAPRTELLWLLLPLLAWSLSAGGADTAPSQPSAPQTPIIIKVKAAPASPEALQQWKRKTWMGSYDQAGVHDPKWDAKAREALTILVDRTSSASEITPEWMEKVSGAFQGAMDAGCTDPLIRNLYLRWSKQAHELPATARAERATKIIQDAEGRDYSPAAQFYISLRAGQMMEEAYFETRVSNWWTRGSAVHEKAGERLCRLLADADLPSQEAINAFSAFLHSLEKLNFLLDYYYPFLFRPAFEHWSENPVMRREESYFWRRYAWAARGSGWVSTVTEKNAQLFEERLIRARAALTKAWELDPKDPQAPTDMINVLLGLDEERGEMELWFNRAMKLNTNNYGACKNKLWYLDPRWHGSDEDLIAFGRECVASKRWGGQVPLILADAHSAIRAYNFGREPERSAYWRRPEVWPDVKASFDRFFQLNADAVNYHQNYAFYAYRCQQWDELSRQLSLMRTTNYSIFGGKGQFEKMLKEAAAHAPAK
jgi:hypothetical protein